MWRDKKNVNINTPKDKEPYPEWENSNLLSLQYRTDSLLFLLASLCNCNSVLTQMKGSLSIWESTIFPLALSELSSQTLNLSRFLRKNLEWFEGCFTFRVHQFRKHLNLSIWAFSTRFPCLFFHQYQTQYHPRADCLPSRERYKCSKSFKDHLVCF